ncbi:phage tail protein [Enterococcus phoeniculicola]|jgi:phage-related protein|uniref:Phage tail tape measure protein, TP901 family, core region n=1 Tax=Enterococcus phoeniculicola ATCC BAA-412 TaxID=1158610 RepID=R3W2F5_9ENTE|nr:hypothetical protein [Enterococcus phoeniculicola]EOL41621.1 hypothetical protein UC3_03185 [Enterococcus phoeniculicola ATCC BAA-412]EOT78885.1 hypothetical protein I589_00391 [Enterococcus phoeniculicola ATCC BAA-412]
MESHRIETILSVTDQNFTYTMNTINETLKTTDEQAEKTKSSFQSAVDEANKMGSSIVNTVKKLDVFNIIDSGIGLLKDSFGEAIQRFDELDRASGTMGISEGIGSARESVTTGFTEIIAAVDEGLQKANLGSIGDIIGNAGAIMGEILLKAAEFIPPIIEFVTNFIGSLSGLEPILPVVGGMILAFIGYLAGMSIIGNIVGMMGSLTTAISFLLSPVGLVVLAIGALVGAIVYLWNTNEGFREAIISAWNAITEFLQPIIANIAMFIQNAFNGLLTWWQENQQSIMTVVNTVWTVISNIFTTVVKVITTVVKGAFEQIKAIIDFVMTFISGIIHTVLSLIKGDWDGVLEGVMTIVGAFGDFITSTFSNFMEAGKEIIGTVLDGIKDLFSSLGDIDLLAAGRAVIDGFVNGLKETWEAGKEFVSGIGDWILDHKGPISYDKKLLIPAGRAIMNGLNKGLNDTFLDVQNNVSSMAGILTDSFEKVAPESIDVKASIRRSFSGMNAQMEHDVNVTSGTKPAVINVRLGKQQFSAFVNDISNEMGAESEINLAF